MRKSCTRTGSGEPFGRHSRPAILEIADQFLLLGINEDGGLSCRKCDLHTLVDVGELCIAIRVVAALAGLAIGLQTIAKRTQQLADHAVTDLMAKLTQSGRDVAQALRRPQ
jgi:hypothetical protein